MTRFKLFAILAAVGFIAGPLFATPSVQPLTAQEAALHGGATHVVELEHNDFSETTTNTAETVALFTVPANACVRFVYADLVTAFQDSSDTNHNQSALTVGDGDDVDRYLTSMELNANGTEAWVQWSSLNGGTIAVTPVTTSLVYATNVTDTTSAIVYSGADTNTLTTTTVVTATSPVYATNTVATSATAVFTAAALGERVYTSADTVDAVLTPNAADATASLNTGLVRLYFQFFGID